MIIKPNLEDAKIIGFYLGKITIGVGITMLIPLGLALLLGEINPVFDFLIGFLISMIVGGLLVSLCRVKVDLSFSQGMVVVSLAWLLAAFLGAIPFHLSGCWNGFLDSYFDSMSGFATTGLVLVRDLDHLSLAHNLWRHLIMFLGGQGIVVIALSFLFRGAAAFKIYVAEARGEKVLPNIVQTARFMWLVSLVYLFFGTLVLGLVAFWQGIPLKQAIFHGVCIFMAAFDTGGFTPYSQNMIYYHSFPFEITTMMFMVLGALNFRLHYALWRGNRREIYRNIETVTFFTTLMLGAILVSFALGRDGTYPGLVAHFRRGFYQIFSAHTGTGYATVYGKQLIKEWSPLAVVALIFGMSLGGASCSTTGGIKALRVALVAKALLADIKKAISPGSAVGVEKFHHIQDIVLEDKTVRSCFLIFFCYLGLYGLGTIVAMLVGYPFLESLFESTSAAANVGLSVGITSPSMPVILKVIYILQMWTGRLEFMSVFVLGGFLLSLVRGK